MFLKGILLLNVGTPDNCDPRSVHRYLRQFLNDPKVVDLPALLRWLLVNVLILPFRFRKSAKAYQKIWQDEGSPLLVQSLQLKNALSQALGKDYCAEIGMRYGNPSIEKALSNLKHCKSIQIIPLYPQYSVAATESAVHKALDIISQQKITSTITLQKDFYNHPGFIKAYANIINEHLKGRNVDCLLMSYHGLPLRQISKKMCQASCDRTQTCPGMNSENQNCYRAQCFATSELLARACGLTSAQYRVGFQSRLGLTPWIKPYTDFLLPELRNQAYQNIAIVSPSFVVDCLETLEEINIRARLQWQKLGGGDFIFIPCLNTDSIWINALEEMVVQQNTE